MSCAKTAKLIDFPFGLWTWVGPMKHKFNCIRQVAQMCLTTLCHELCKNGWTVRFAVWVVDSGGLKEAQVPSYSPGGATWRIRWNCLSAAAMWPYAKLLWPLVTIVIVTF